MSTIIDSLIVELGLDAKGLEAKAPKSVAALTALEKQGAKAEASNKKLDKSTKEASRSIEGLSRTVAGFLAVIGGTVAIKNFVSDFINTNAQLDRLSKNLGLSVATISAWSNASEKLGGTAQGLQGTLDMLSKSQTQLMLTGESSLLPYMSALGVSLADVTGKARPVTDILLDLSDRFSGLDRTTANNMGRMMGLDQGTLNILLQGRKELELEISRQKEQTAVTKEQAAQAQKFQTQVVGLKQQFNALGRSLFMEAAPYLEKFFNLIQTFANWMLAHQQFVSDFLRVLAIGLGAIALVTAPINLTVAAVVALAGAIALLWDDYQVWAKGGKSLFDWGDFAAGIGVAKDAVIWLGKAFKEAYEWWSKWMNRGHENDKGWIGIPTNSHAGSSVDPITKQRVKNPIVSVVDQAKQLSQKVSEQTGIPADLIFSQWAHETGDFTNRGSTQLNNLAGINVPGGKGQDYRKFDSLEEFGNYYTYLMRKSGPYSSARNAKTPEQFAAALKAGGYYGDSESNYAAGLRSKESKYFGGSQYASSLTGTPGAASIVTNAPTGNTGSQTTIDRSIQTQISQMTINTAATDAQGIARDLAPSLDYLFASQANFGLVP
jgi:Mannosyl-glycoprotein endo-beta-N-acetylglucosaminidase